MPRLHTFLNEPYTAAIVGCPSSSGTVTPSGVELGPEHLITAGLPKQIKDLGWQLKFDSLLNIDAVKPLKDLQYKKVKNPHTVSKINKLVADTCSDHLRQGRFAVTLGGDQSITMGSIAGTLTQFYDACVIWVDAHADIHTVESTISGCMNRMPASFLLGIGSKIPDFNWLTKKLPAHRIVYIGLRHLDQAEKRILKGYNILSFSMHEIDKYGIGRVMDMALDHVNPIRNLPIHLSIDVDALDPSEAPSTSKPVIGGLTYREGLYICEVVNQTGLLVAMDLVEFNPTVGDAAAVQKTTDASCALVRAAMGESRIPTLL